MFVANVSQDPTKEVVGANKSFNQATENGVEQMVSKEHQSASGHITMHQLCFALQSLFLQKGHAYTCINIFGPFRTS